MRAEGGPTAMLIGRASAQQLLYEWNETAAEYPQREVHARVV